MAIFENYKSIRISGKAYEKLRKMADEEHITIKESIDVLLDIRGRLQIQVMALRNYLEMLIFELKKEGLLSGWEE